MMDALGSGVTDYRGGSLQAQREEIRGIYAKFEENLFISGQEGYWSNLNTAENVELIHALENMGTRDAVKKHHPLLYDIIFSPKRWGGLGLLDFKGDESCVDYGCMWGALTVTLANRCKYVLGVDQTLNSLKFLQKRIKEDGLDNVDLLCADLKNMKSLKNKFDIAIINGVLEWIPEQGSIELKTYYGKYYPRDYDINPRRQQIVFLKKAYENLNESGRLYLAIENRFDFKMFLGAKDPHADIRLVSIIPRKLADILSRLRLGRPYVNWLYSFKGIDQLLKESGFRNVDLYMCFPDYRFPEVILPYESTLHLTDAGSRLPIMTISGKENILKKTIKKSINHLFGITNLIIPLNVFSPSIIAIGHK